MNEFYVGRRQRSVSSVVNPVSTDSGLALRDDALERGIGERMIFGANGEPFVPRVQGRSSRNGPRFAL